MEELLKDKALPDPPMTLAWFIWGLGAMFYLVGFFQRVAPAVMTRELMQDFQISASGLGNLSALYFYAYVAMQIPTGILADTVGPRKLLSGGCLMAGLGTLFFAFSPTFWGAGCGRLMIGGSVAVAFVGLLKLSSTWFPKKFYAFVAGNALSIGAIGAISAGPPLRFLMDHFHWRQVFGVAGIMTLALSVMIWMVVRNWPQEKGYAGFIDRVAQPEAVTIRGVFQGLRTVLSYRNTWLLFFIPGGVVGCLLTFTGLWGVPFLVSHHGLSQGVAAALTSIMLISWAVGGPFFGWLSDRMGRRKPLYIGSVLVLSVCWSLIFFRANLPFSQLIALFIVSGFCSACMIVTFAFGSESVPIRLSGTVSGLLNMGVMAAPMLLQPLVGIILDFFWAGEMVDGVRVYSFHAYAYGFIPVIGWLFLSFLLLCFTRETQCRQIA